MGGGQVFAVAVAVAVVVVVEVAVVVGTEGGPQEWRKVVG